ncbi:MAG: hypothetical protein EHM24_11210 [Acidobacteria bacterium]|nr:MAG: hypothetical protein EHM24_11210 [Acidobacteriota bacterium]
MPGCDPAWCTICNGRDAAYEMAEKAKGQSAPKPGPRRDNLPAGGTLPEVAYEPQFSGARWERQWLRDGRPIPTPGARKPQPQRMRSREKRPASDHDWQARPLDQPGGATAAENDERLAYRQRVIRRAQREADRREAADKRAERSRQRAKARARRRGAPVPAWAHTQSKRETIRSMGPPDGEGS